MNTYETDFGFTELTISELDNIALNHNSILGYGSVERGVYPGVDEDYCREGWKAKIVGKCLDNEAGMLVLRPCNPRTWVIWQQGKVNYLVSKGIPEPLAREYTELNTKYIWEDKVIDAVAACLKRGRFIMSESLSKLRNTTVEEIVNRLTTTWHGKRIIVTLDDIAA